MTILGGAGIAVFVVLFALYLKPQQKEYSVLFVIFGTVILFFLAVQRAGEAVQFIRETVEKTAFASEIGTLIKALGIAAVAQIASDVCREAGEATVAGQVELIGKTEILLLSLPLAARLMALMQDLLS